jgi:hypothetical protein
MNKTIIFQELIQNQRKNIISDKKLSLSDLKRISLYLSNSIFTSDCSLWDGYVTEIKNNNAFVNFFFNGKKYALQRLLYINYVGYLNDSEYIKFSCDNKGKCCNVNHFHKIIKDLNVVHDMIEIRSVNGVMSFSGKGEQSQGQVILTEGEKDENLKFKKKDNSIYQGRFSLKNMMILYKCTSLCPNVELYLENDTPLFIKYNIGRLGYTYLILAPVVEDVTKLENNIKVDDEDDDES